MKREKVALLLKDNRIIELTNVSKYYNNFKIDAIEFYNHYDNIKAIIHTHEQECNPSALDEIYMVYWNFPWIILSEKCVKAYQYSDFSILEVDVKSLVPQELYNLLMQLL